MINKTLHLTKIPDIQINSFQINNLKKKSIISQNISTVNFESKHINNTE